MKKLLRFFLYTLFFIAALIYFSPKISTYYYGEHIAQKYGVVVSKEELSDNGYGLKIQDASISFKGVQSADVAKIDLKLYGLYNALDVEDVKLSSTAAAFVPTKIESINVRHTLLDPVHIQIKARGDFGEIEGYVDVLERQVHLRLLPSKVMLKDFKSTLRNLKREKNGEYTYDKTF